MILSHSAILAQILNFTWNWICNYELPWDGFTFTILDYFTFCCIVFIIGYAVWHLVFFFARYISRLDFSGDD